MGKEKYLKEIELLFKKSPIVKYSSINRIIKNKNNVKQYDKRFINYLLKKNKIKRITKGYYTIFDDSSLAVLCFQPSYLGLQDALSLNNLWEQETIPVIITIKKIRPGIREILGNNVLIRRIKKKYFFGIQYIQQDNIAFPYSDIEKTFIDMVYFKEKMDKDVINNFKEKINNKKLNKYLSIYPKRIRSKVINILKS